jgi:arginase family enzyme
MTSSTRGESRYPVWIHLDADVLSDDVMPAVDYRMPGGLQPDELTDALAVALASPWRRPRVIRARSATA